MHTQTTWPCQNMFYHWNLVARWFAKVNQQIRKILNWLIVELVYASWCEWGTEIAVYDSCATVLRVPIVRFLWRARFKQLEVYLNQFLLERRAEIELTAVCAVDFGKHPVETLTWTFYFFCCSYWDWHGFARRSFLLKHLWHAIRAVFFRARAHGSRTENSHQF